MLFRSPAYAQHRFDRVKASQQLQLLASRDGRSDSLALQQDVDLWMTQLDTTTEVRTFELRPGRNGWLQVARGTVVVNGRELAEGDAAAVTDEPITLTNGEHAEVLVFDIA